MALRLARLKKLARGQFQHQIHRRQQGRPLDVDITAVGNEEIAVRRQIEQDQVRAYLDRVNRCVELSAFERSVERIGDGGLHVAVRNQSLTVIEQRGAADRAVSDDGPSAVSRPACPTSCGS